MSNDKIETNNNLISIGNEIISSNLSQKMLTIPAQREKNIKKELKEDISIKTIKPYNSINSFRNSNISTLSDIRKKTFFDLSKLNYKDGLILKDATNSNPGFGLWSIKLSQSLKNSNSKKEEKIMNKIYNINNPHPHLNFEIKEEISDSENNDILYDSLENNFEEDQVDKIMISKLTKRSKRLEKKYQNLLINYYEKENQYLSLERARKEYEQLINKSIKEKTDEQNNLNNLDNNNQALIVSITNSRREIERLINVIKQSQFNMKKEMEEYNKVLIKEEEKRKKIINAIKSGEKQISIFKDQLEENDDKINYSNTSDVNNTTEKKKANIIKEREKNINKKKDYIKKLQEELERLYSINKEKQNEKKDLFEKINEMNKDKKRNIKYKNEIFKELEKQENNNKWNEQAIKIRNNIIDNLKKNTNS